MKWCITLIALWATLVTTSPTPKKTVDFPNNHGATLALAERGICTDDDDKCCCLCASADAWPCIGCTQVINSKQ